MADFGDFLSVLSDDIFEERPVDLQEFLYSKDFMALPKLSPIQEEIVDIGSNIYYKDTWEKLYGLARALELTKRNKKELLFVLGKACHAPYTPVYNPDTGTWQRLDSFTSLHNRVVGVHDGEDKLIEQYATEAFQEGFGEMIRVTTQLGYVEDVYVGHKYLSFKKNKFYKRKRDKNVGTYQRIDELKVGDRIAIPLSLPVNNPIGHDLNEVTLVAYWVGDGCIPKKAKKTCLNIDFNEYEVESLKRYTNACDSLEITYSVKKHPTKKMFMVQHSGLLSNNKVVGDILDKYDMWGKGAGDKRIPAPIWELSNVDLAYFIACLWSTNGCVYLKKCEAHLPMPTAELCSISKGLAEDLQKALLRIGSPSSIRSRIPNYIYKGKKLEGQRAYYLTINSTDLFTKFSEKVGFMLKDNKAAKLKEGMAICLNKNSIYDRSSGEIYWDQIKNIEILPQGEYWTLTAPETHSYVGNGLVSAQSGKDLLSEIICARVVYFLLCLKNPAGYYGKPQDDAIDIVNVARDSLQASAVYFKGLKTRIKHCKWFNGKYKALALTLEFDKSITVHSKNSESEGTEGLNILLAILDEWDSFDKGDTTSNGDAMYKTLRGTVSSRFDDVGKLLILSFPRKKDGAMMKKYNEFVADKIVTKYSHTFVLNPELPPGTENNEFSVEWEEDEIISYKYSNVWALRRPTWRVNPTKTIDSFIMDFYADPADALGRFAACPQDTDGINDWYKDKAKVDATFVNLNGVGADGSIRLEPNSEKQYYIHVDLALKQDNAALALAHVEDFKRFKIASTVLDAAPHVIVDLVRYWKPSKDRPLDFTDIREFIISLRRKGFDIRKVTFDRWNSDQIMKALNEIGIRAEKLSVARDHYNEFALTMGENRLVGPDSELLKKELKTIIINDKGKVDHPGRTGNDLADAVCGAIFNATNLTPQKSGEIEIVTYADIKREKYDMQRTIFEKNNIINAPKTPIPAELKSFIEGIRIL